MNRRKFLKKTGQLGATFFAVDPVRIFFSSVVESAFHNAYALENAETYFDEAKYVALCLVGGPLRNAWDLIIKPNGESDPFFHNKDNILNHSFYINRLQLDSSRPEGFNASYQMIQDPDSKLYLPHLWSGQLPTPDAGSVPMMELAKNMAVLRGINMGDTHTQGRKIQTSPLGKTSISGMVADRSQSPLPALGFSSPNLFKSEKGLSQTAASLPNPVSSVFTSLIHPGGRSYLHEFDDQIDAVLNVMKAKAGDKSRLLPTTFIDRFNARKLLSKNLSLLIQQFYTVQRKYEDLISRSYSSAFALSDADGLELAPVDTPHFLFGAKQKRIIHPSMRGVFDRPTIGALAASMAIAEIFLTGLELKFSFSSSLSLGVSSASGLKMETQGDSTIVFENDSHHAGNIVHLYVNNPYYRAISACLYELICKLKSVPAGSGKTLFDNTVIDINSEFNRVGGEDGFSTNHGGAYSCRTLFSGMIPRLTVGGNIYAHGKLYYPGGCAAPVKAFQGQLAGIGNVCSTVATLLGVRSPSPNSASFLMFDSNQKAKLAVEAPTNVI